MENENLISQFGIGHYSDIIAKQSWKRLMSIILDDNISPQAESLDRISAMQAQEVIFKSGLEYCNKVVKDLLDRADGEDGTINKALCKEILIGTAEKLNYL